MNEFNLRMSNIFKKMDKQPEKPIEVPKPRYDDPVEEAAGPRFHILKQTVVGYSQPVFYSLPDPEATRRCDELNQKEIQKRHYDETKAMERGLEYKPEAKELIMYEKVEADKKEQLSPYYNPKKIVTGEL